MRANDGAERTQWKISTRQEVSEKAKESITQSSIASLDLDRVQIEWKMILWEGIFFSVFYSILQWVEQLGECENLHVYRVCVTSQLAEEEGRAERF